MYVPFSKLGNDDKTSMLQGIASGTIKAIYNGEEYFIKEEEYRIKRKLFSCSRLRGM